MNYVKLLLATVGGAVANFLAGWLVYGMLLGDSMGNGMSDAAKATMLPMEQHHIVYYFLGSLFFALLLALIYERWANIRTFMTGAIAGAVIAGLYELSISCNFMAGMNWYTSMSTPIMSALITALMGGLTGGVVGWLLGWNRN